MTTWAAKTEEIDPAVTITPDAGGTPVTVSPTTYYTYDRLNRQVENIDPLHNTSFDVYDLDGNVVQTTDADGRTTQYIYDPLNRQVEEDWLDANGNVYHTIQTFYDADGETVGVTESDLGTSLHTANTSDATDYEYSYDQDGNVLTSRMAPGDLRSRRNCRAAAAAAWGRSGPGIGTETGCRNRSRSCLWRATWRAARLVPRVKSRVRP